MVVSIVDVAEYILHKSGSMSAWKLQKLCYYAQAWTLAWEGRPLFQEDFQAWRNGPVCSALFEWHEDMFTISYDDPLDGNPDALTESDKENVNAVLEHYGDKAPYWLSEQSRSERPWRTARGDLLDDASSSTIISKNDMGEYYGSL